MKTYKEGLSEMWEYCSNWDNEADALQEAFDKGIEFQKKQEVKNDVF